jgi:hypothetical protein
MAALPLWTAHFAHSIIKSQEKQQPSSGTRSTVYIHYDVARAFRPHVELVCLLQQILPQQVQRRQRLHGERAGELRGLQVLLQSQAPLRRRCQSLRRLCGFDPSFWHFPPKQRRVPPGRQLPGTISYRAQEMFKLVSKLTQVSDDLAVLSSSPYFKFLRRFLLFLYHRVCARVSTPRPA